MDYSDRWLCYYVPPAKFLHCRTEVKGPKHRPWPHGQCKHSIALVTVVAITAWVRGTGKTAEMQTEVFRPRPSHAHLGSSSSPRGCLSHHAAQGQATRPSYPHRVSPPCSQRAPQTLASKSLLALYAPQVTTNFLFLKESLI